MGIKIDIDKIKKAELIAFMKKHHLEIPEGRVYKRDYLRAILKSFSEEDIIKEYPKAELKAKKKRSGRKKSSVAKAKTGTSRTMPATKINTQKLEGEYSKLKNRVALLENKIELILMALKNIPEINNEINSEVLGKLYTSNGNEGTLSEVNSFAERKDLKGDMKENEKTISREDIISALQSIKSEQGEYNPWVTLEKLYLRMNAISAENKENINSQLITMFNNDEIELDESMESKAKLNIRGKSFGKIKLRI